MLLSGKVGRRSQAFLQKGAMRYASTGLDVMSSIRCAEFFFM